MIEGETNRGSIDPSPAYSLRSSMVWGVARPREKDAVIVFFTSLKGDSIANGGAAEDGIVAKKAEEDCAVDSNGGDAPSSGKWAM